MSAPLLQVNGLSRSFGGLKAVDNVSFQVREGMIKAVIGPNGAGKTTLFNLISGHLGADAGSMSFGGMDIHSLRPHQIAGMGISRTFQHTKLFPHMSALENVMVGRHTRSSAGFMAGMLNLPRTWREEREIKERALEVMDFVGVAEFAPQEATNLAFGQQRLLETARALASEPRLLLLDEPAAGLNMRETERFAELITRIRDRGVTVLIVEHDMSLVMKISEEVMVLSYGQKIAEDVPAVVQKDKEVIRVYLGEDDGNGDSSGYTGGPGGTGGPDGPGSVGGPDGPGGSGGPGGTGGPDGPGGPGDA